MFRTSRNVKMSTIWLAMAAPYLLAVTKNLGERGGQWSS
jgi:hypothetical protein